MTDKELIEDLEEAKKKEPFPILGLFIAVLSILYGEFTIRVDGYFISHVEPYLKGLPEDAIGGILLVLGVIKLIGIFARSYKWKRRGIIGLSAAWSGLFAIATTFSFGTGYPHPSWMFFLLTVGICLIESSKGDFGY